ncbi:hypothetical protein AB4144_26200 [Rhizobiaceae sp. 2RAB30]
MEHEVEVWGQKVTITVYQRSKSAWIASATILEQQFKVQRSTPDAAIKGWIDAAQFRGIDAKAPHDISRRSHRRRARKGAR